MKRLKLIFATMAVIACAGPAHAQNTKNKPRDAEIRKVVEGFSRALAAGDSTAVLALLHPDVVIYEGGHAENLEQYRSGHLRSDIAFSAAVPRSTLSDHVVLADRMATYVSEYTAKGTFRNRAIDSHGTETMVLVKTPAGWKIRHIHWSSR
ncbi:MAG: nuclear transport factor 2 family protein [Longimicrobiales bacterium]